MGHNEECVSNLLTLGFVSCFIWIVIAALTEEKLRSALLDEEIQGCLQRTVLNQEVECYWQVTKYRVDLLRERFESQVGQCYYYQHHKPNITRVLRVC